MDQVTDMPTMHVLQSLNVFLMALGFSSFSNIVGETFLVEYLPAKHRGLWCVLVNIFWGVGVLLMAVCAWAIIPWRGWRVFLVITNAPYCESPVHGDVLLYILRTKCTVTSK